MPIYALSSALLARGWETIALPSLLLAGRSTLTHPTDPDAGAPAPDTVDESATDAVNEVAVAPVDPLDAPTTRPASKRFRKPFNAVRLPADQVRRQGQVASTAWRELGGRDAAVAFLNTHDDALGGRPLDVAMASDEGLATVEQAIVARAAR